MRQQAVSFCRKLARALFIANHYNEWLPQLNLERQERLKAIRAQVEAVVDIVRKESSKFQLRCERINLSTVGADNIPINWFTFQLANSISFKSDKLVSLVKTFAKLDVPEKFELRFQIGFNGKHATYRTTNNLWKIHVSGANHVAINDLHTISFDIEYVENAHAHLIGFDLGHELLHSVLNVHDKDLGDLDFEFYKNNKDLLEKEGLRFMRSVFSRSNDFFGRVSNLINTPFVRSAEQTLEKVISEAFLNLDFPFSPNFSMKGNVSCHLCGSPMEGLMS